MKEASGETGSRILTVSEAARHFCARPATVRARTRADRLEACRLGREFRLPWQDPWAFEAGPVPCGPRQPLYRVPPLTNQSVVTRLGVSTRRVERWIAAGLPTRIAAGLVRLSASDVRGWLTFCFGH